MPPKGDDNKTAGCDEQQLAILEHALGLDRKTTPYRRHYVASEPSSWFDDCEKLVALGLMVQFGPPDRVGQTFHVTQAGADLLGVKLP